MAISAKDVMGLRQRTGLGMMECKKALTETSGDVEGAIALLRTKMKGKMEERSDRESSEGVVAVAHGDGAIAMVSLRCETDFVARNEDFVAAADDLAERVLAGDDGDVEPGDAIKQIVEDLRIKIQENIEFAQGVKLSGPALGSYVHHNRKIGVVVRAEDIEDSDLLKGICQHVAAAVPVPLAVDKDGLPADAVEAQKTTAVEEANAAGKPPEIAEKIATGKLRKWVDENTLMGQIYLRELDAKKPVRDYLPKGGKVTQFVRFQLGS